MPSGFFCILVLAFSGFVSGISGFGFSMVALTLLSLLFEIKSAVVFLAAHTLACNIIQIIKLRKHLSLKSLLPLLAGALSGVPAGVYLLKSMDPWWIKKALGLIVISFVIQQILCPGKAENNGDATPDQVDERKGPNHHADAGLRKKKKTLAGFLVGTAGGALMGGLLSGGPPVIIYSLKSVSNKHQIKAVLQSFFLFSSAYAIILYFTSGLLTFPLLFSSMLYLPATIIGTGLGIWVFEAISFAAFRKIVLVFMTLLGLSLFFK